LTGSPDVRYPSVWYVSPSTVYLVGDSVEQDTEVEVIKGTISGASISWTSEQEATVGLKNNPYQRSFITRDKDGHLWIASSNKISANSPYYNIGVVKSTNTDDITVWDAYTNMLATNVVGDYIYPTVVPFTGSSDGNDDVMVVWYENGNLASKKYVGGSWSSVMSLPDATTTSGVSTKIPSVISETNTDSANARIHVIYSNSTGQIKHAYFADRTASAWTAGVIVDSNTGNEYPSLSVDTSDGDFYACFVRSGQIYCNNSTSPYTSWDSLTMESTSGISHLSTSYSGATDNLYIISLETLGSNYNVTGYFAVPEFNLIVPPIIIQIVLAFGIIMRKKKRKWKKQNRPKTY